MEKHMNSFDRTIRSLCQEIDQLKEEVDYWRELYEKEKMQYSKLLNDNLKEAQKGVANALLFAMSVSDDENGNLVISKEKRKDLSETWSKS